VRETGFGCLAPPNNVQGLAQTIIETLRDREKYEPNRAAVRAIFSTERSLMQYDEVLERIVREHSRSRARKPAPLKSAQPDGEK
jgi:glycosyltransferase involved in cell wall biosynthesis